MNLRTKAAGILAATLALALSVSSLAADAEEERRAKLAILEAACEVARLEKLVPLRQKHVEECVSKKERPDRESCERYYADYGNGTGNQRFFYDLPACETAFEFFKSGS